MKKQYNLKYKKHYEIVQQVNKIESDKEILQNKISKLNIKKRHIISLIDNNFYNQFKENYKRIPLELISFIFEFLGFYNHHHKSVKVSTYDEEFL